MASSSSSSSAIQLGFTLGHVSLYYGAKRRKLPGSHEAHTHIYSIYVRGMPTRNVMKLPLMPLGPESVKLDCVIDNVTYYMWSGYSEPVRTIRSPPFQVFESGHSGFEVHIYITIKPFAPSKTHQETQPLVLYFFFDLFHYLYSHATYQRPEYLYIERPSNELRQLALAAGGVSVKGSNDASARTCYKVPPVPIELQIQGPSGIVVEPGDDVRQDMRIEWQAIRKLLNFSHATNRKTASSWPACVSRTKNDNLAHATVDKLPTLYDTVYADYVKVGDDAFNEYTYWKSSSSDAPQPKVLLAGGGSKKLPAAAKAGTTGADTANKSPMTLFSVADETGGTSKKQHHAGEKRRKSVATVSTASAVPIAVPPIATSATKHHAAPPPVLPIAATEKPPIHKPTKSSSSKASKKKRASDASLTATSAAAVETAKQHAPPSSSSNKKIETTNRNKDKPVTPPSVHATAKPSSINTTPASSPAARGSSPSGDASSSSSSSSSSSGSDTSSSSNTSSPTAEPSITKQPASVEVKKLLSPLPVPSDDERKKSGTIVEKPSASIPFSANNNSFTSSLKPINNNDNKAVVTSKTADKKPSAGVAGVTSTVSNNNKHANDAVLPPPPPSSTIAVPIVRQLTAVSPTGTRKIEPSAAVAARDAEDENRPSFTPFQLKQLNWMAQELIASRYPLPKQNLISLFFSMKLLVFNDDYADDESVKIEAVDTKRRASTGSVSGHDKKKKMKRRLEWRFDKVSREKYEALCCLFRLSLDDDDGEQH